MHQPMLYNNLIRHSIQLVPLFLEPRHTIRSHGGLGYAPTQHLRGLGAHHSARPFRQLPAQELQSPSVVHQVSNGSELAIL